MDTLVTNQHINLKVSVCDCPLCKHPLPLPDPPPVRISMLMFVACSDQEGSNVYFTPSRSCYAGSRREGRLVEDEG